MIDKALQFKNNYNNHNNHNNNLDSTNEERLSTLVFEEEFTNLINEERSIDINISHSLEFHNSLVIESDRMSTKVRVKKFRPVGETLKIMEYMNYTLRESIKKEEMKEIMIIKDDNNENNEEKNMHSTSSDSSTREVEIVKENLEDFYNEVTLNVNNKKFISNLVPSP